MEGWNSKQCGTCWSLTYVPTGNTIYVTLIDHADNGFNIGKKGMNELTNDQAKDLGKVKVNFKQVDKSKCGFY